MSLGKKLKEEALTQVMENESETWKAKYVSMVNDFLKTHARFNNDDVREYMQGKGLGEPHHSGVWGSMFSAHFAKNQFVVTTGLTASAKKTSSKARRQSVWRSLLCAEDGCVVTLNQQLLQLMTQVRTRELGLLEALKMAAQFGAESVSNQ